MFVWERKSQRLVRVPLSSVPVFLLSVNCLSCVGSCLLWTPHPFQTLRRAPHSPRGHLPVSPASASSESCLGCCFQRQVRGAFPKAWLSSPVGLVTGVTTLSLSAGPAMSLSSLGRLRWTCGLLSATFSISLPVRGEEELVALPPSPLFFRLLFAFPLGSRLLGSVVSLPPLLPAPSLSCRFSLVSPGDIPSASPG